MRLFLRYGLIALIIGGLISASYWLGLFSGWEYFLQDRLYSNKPISSQLVIVAIDDASLQRIGQWPWPRATFAALLEELKKVRPQAVGIDVTFAEASRIGPSDDGLLERSLQEAAFPVVLPVESTAVQLQRGQAESARLLYPLPQFMSAPQVSLGHVNLVSDNDGVVRTYPPILLLPDATTVSGFANQLSGGRASPDGFLVRIVYGGQPGSVKRLPFWEVIAGNHTSELENKIILVGATAADLHDTKPTPLSAGTEMPGVEIQASIVNMLLQGYELKPVSWPVVTLIFFLIALIPAVVFILVKRTAIAIIINAVLGAVYLITAVIFFQAGKVLPVVHMQAAWMLATAGMFSYRYWVLDRERYHLRHVFGKYVSREVMEAILADPMAVKLGGEEREVTVFFSDIRGFTSISETISPQELVRVLNRYFNEMTTEVLRTRGVVDKYIGDAIMAFWGAPLADHEHADHALETSIAMIKKLKDLNIELKKIGDPEINIGIGLYTGSVIVGNVGSEDRFDYTVIGDTVNAASRLEGLNKEYATQIIISETTKNQLRGHYPLRHLGEVTVKGRREPISIYCVEVDRM